MTEYVGSISSGRLHQRYESADSNIVDILGSDEGFYSTGGCLLWNAVASEEE